MDWGRIRCRVREERNKGIEEEKETTPWKDPLQKVKWEENGT